MADQWLAVLVLLRGIAFGFAAWLTWRFMRRSEFKAICLAGIYRDSAVALLAAARALFLVWPPPAWLQSLVDLGGTGLVIVAVLFLSTEVRKP